MKIYINENLYDDLFIDVIANRYANVCFTIYKSGNSMISSIYKKRYKNIDLVLISRLNNKINTICRDIFIKYEIIKKIYNNQFNVIEKYYKLVEE